MTTKKQQPPEVQTEEEAPPDPLWAIEALVNDPDFQGRVRASVAKESEYGSIPTQADPVGAAFQERYAIAATPGFAADYAYAVEAGTVQRPGLDPAVIGDDQIGSAVVKAFPKPEPSPVIDNELPEPE